jgi:hypothetical protein
VVDLDVHAIRWRIADKTLVRRIALKLRVEADPYFAVLFANRRDEDVPRLLADRLGFFAPADVTPFERLKGFGRLVAQATEVEARAIGTPDLCLEDLVEPAQAQRLYLIA